MLYKTKQTNLERYGLTSALQLDKAKANAKIVMQNKYGVDYPFQSQEIIKKGKTTSNRLYGPNWETVVEKMIDTKRKNHTFNTSYHTHCILCCRIIHILPVHQYSSAFQGNYCDIKRKL